MSRKDKSVKDQVISLEKIIEKKEAEIFCLKSIIDHIPGDVYWKNQQGIYIGINATGSESLRKMGFIWKSNDIVGKTDFDLYEEKTAKKFRKNDLQVMKTGTENSMEETAILPSGEKIVQLSTKRPLWDENGKVIGIVGNTIDITYLKKIEEDLRTAKEAAEKAHQAEVELKKTKHQLEGAKLISGSIAHEIRTPLATIKFAVFGVKNTLSKLTSVNEIVGKKYPSIKTVKNDEIANMKDALDSVNKKVDQANMIINMLLTKLQSVDFEFSGFSICSASICIQDALDEFVVPDNMTHKIDFNKDNDFEFLGNDTLVKHVIMNLLKNAIFYILKAAKGEITIWLEQHTETNEIHFKDTGTGIAAKILPHIFDSFFTTESSTGTGVGLAFSKMVMQSHRGSINCMSVKGKYTEFILSFPKLDNL